MLASFKACCIFNPLEERQNNDRETCKRFLYDNHNLNNNGFYRLVVVVWSRKQSKLHLVRCNGSLWKIGY